MKERAEPKESRLVDTSVLTWLFPINSILQEGKGRKKIHNSAISGQTNQ